MCDKKNTIVVVEDNIVNLRLFLDILELDGLNAHPISNGTVALDEITKILPSLILMDIQLNIEDICGIDIIKQLKANEKTKFIPIIAITAFASKYDEEKILQAGCIEYMSKPVSVEPFLKVVRKYLVN